MFTKLNKLVPLLVLALAMTLAMGALAAPPEGKGKPNGEATAGNNLSYPVLWAEGVTKDLRGTPGTVLTEGEWWYQWGTNGTEPDVTPAACPPDEDDAFYCDDGLLGSVGPDPRTLSADNYQGLVRAFIQKDPLNEWQAGSLDVSDTPLVVDWIDWGDNLESVDWYTRSQVRTEVVLFEDLMESLTEYEMRHTSGWGINEVHGLAAALDGTVTPLDGYSATVYSPCARFTIQKLAVEREDPALDPLLGNLVWVPGQGWIESESYEGDLINDVPLFNKAVHEALDGPGYYNAEINVKGRIIYGYTWSVRKLNEGAGDYRLTFSFDESCGAVDLNTSFADGETEIIVPIEEEVVVTEAESTEGGGVGVLDFGNNLTYMDIRIHERTGGGGGGGNGGGGGGGGGRPHTSPTPSN